MGSVKVDQDRLDKGVEVALERDHKLVPGVDQEQDHKLAAGVDREQEAIQDL